MCQNATVGRPCAAVALLLALGAALGDAQSRRPEEGPPWPPDWRRVGSTVVHGTRLPSPSTGPVERVWYAPDGSSLLVLTREHGVFRWSAEEEQWSRAAGETVPQADAPVLDLAAEPLLARGGMQFRRAAAPTTRLYAFLEQIYRSDDGGRHWYALTSWRGKSILGGVIRDLAVSPRNADEITAVNEFGVWRSMDGGLSWRGLNEGLPNFPVRRILLTPGSGTLLVAAVEGYGALAWHPGERQGWQAADAVRFAQEEALRAALSERLEASVTALAAAQSVRYAGAADGRIWVSRDDGESWRLSRAASGSPVTSIWVDGESPQTAVAALASPAEGRVIRTTNAGLYWDDLSSGLPAGVVWGVTADRASGALYAATSAGLYYARVDLLNPTPGATWVDFTGSLPAGALRDVRLDAAGNQLYVAVDGEGVFATLAPHRAWSLRLVNSGDLTPTAASPGGLFTVLGSGVSRAWAGDKAAPVLDSTIYEAQIQIPFDVQGDALAVALEGPQGRSTFGLPLRAVAPTVVVDVQGAPLLLDGDTGMLLDAGNPAVSRGRVQVLMTGLGKVTPEWVTGMAAPLEAPPKVVARITAYVDRQPVEVTRATLAPGYIGFYLVEFTLPAILNAGPAELFLDVDGQRSNIVRIYLQP